MQVVTDIEMGRFASSITLLDAAEFWLDEGDEHAARRAITFAKMRLDELFTLMSAADVVRPHTDRVM